MALLESGQKDRARAMFRKAKSFKAKGAGLEEKILEQIRSSTKLIDRLYARRRKAIHGIRAQRAAEGSRLHLLGSG